MKTSDPSLENRIFLLQKKIEDHRRLNKTFSPNSILEEVSARHIVVMERQLFDLRASVGARAGGARRG